MDASKYKTHLTVFGAIVAIYGIFGWLDVANYAQGGWGTDRNNVVNQVLAGSPAEAGGLMIGDKIIKLGGILISDASALAQRARPEIGETWEFVVERNGAQVNLDITFGEPVAQRKLIAHAAFLAGFCFLGFTLRAYIQRQTPSTAALALAGTTFSLVFITGPYFADYTMRMIDNAVTSLIVFIGVASILNFLLVHLRSSSNRLIYLPGLAAGLFIAWRVLATPESTDALNTFASIFIGAIALFYLVGSLVTVYKSYSAASASDRESNGLNLMLIGALVGILPPAISILTNVIAPSVVLPGQPFYFLSFVALPITWSMAVLKGGAATE